MQADETFKPRVEWSEMFRSYIERNQGGLGGVSKKVIFHDDGRRGGSRPPLRKQDQGDLCRSPEVLFVTKIEFLGHFFPQEVV